MIVFASFVEVLCCGVHASMIEHGKSPEAPATITNIA